MHQRYRLLNLLADGRFHSGEKLGNALGIGRSAVWKLVRSLAPLGIDCHAVTGKGYRLANPIELLDREQILAELSSETRAQLDRVEVLNEIDSTNAHLVRERNEDDSSARACFAEFQSAGRGRRGRQWLSPFGTNIYLSVCWYFESTPEVLQGLSLALGVQAARAIASCHIEGVKLKWPNDLVWNDKKLGGILVEMTGESSGPWRIVAGIGLNVGMPRALGSSIDQPWTNLSCITETVVGRNQLAGRLLHHVLLGLTRFSREGFRPFRDEWQRLDAIRGQTVVLDTGRGVMHGLAQGVDDTGALLLSTGGHTRRFVSGDISVRVAP
jgi:BirA family biotin operon repressor/biotin-[acetyl-CoA-carboxylase] ligase